MCIDSPVITKHNAAVQQTAEKVQKAAENVAKSEQALRVKHLDSEQKDKADDLLQKAAESKEAWLAAYDKFVELNRTRPGRKSMSQRQDVVQDLKGTAKEYHTASTKPVQLVEAAPNMN